MLSKTLDCLALSLVLIVVTTAGLLSFPNEHLIIKDDVSLDTGYRMETEEKISKRRPSKLAHGSPVLEERMLKGLTKSRYSPSRPSNPEGGRKASKSTDRPKMAVPTQLSDHGLLDLLRRLRIDDIARTRFFNALGEQPYTSLHSTILHTVRRPWTTPYTTDVVRQILDTLDIHAAQRHAVLGLVNSDHGSSSQLKELMRMIDNRSIVGRTLGTVPSPIKDEELLNLVRHLQRDIHVRQRFFQSLQERNHLLLYIDFTKILNLPFNRHLHECYQSHLLHTLNNNPGHRMRLLSRINTAPEKAADFRALTRTFIPHIPRQPATAAVHHGADADAVITDEQLCDFIRHLQTNGDDRVDFFDSFARPEFVRLHTCFVRVQGMSWHRAANDVTLQPRALAEVGTSVQKRCKLLHVVNGSLDSRRGLKRLMEDFG